MYCDYCSYKDVCKYRIQFEEIQEMVRKYINNYINEHLEFPKDMTTMESGSPKCKSYQKLY